jgi:hypothetical protein
MIAVFVWIAVSAMVIPIVFWRDFIAYFTKMKL